MDVASQSDKWNENETCSSRWAEASVFVWGMEQDIEA